MKRYVHTTIKMSLASLMSILLAELIGLEYAVTAGILAVLSVQLTRRDSYTIAGKRLLDAILALILSGLMFYFLGYNVYIFTLFTVVFIALSFALKVQVGIVPSLVLASHLLLYGEFNFGLIINGLLLIGVAIIVTLVLNLIYPLNIKKTMQLYTDRVDALIKEDIALLADYLRDAAHQNAYHIKHQSIETELNQVLNAAKLVDRDILFAKDHLHMSYILMRDEQLNRLSRLFDLTKGLRMQHLHALVLSDYIAELSEDIGHQDKATLQLKKLNDLVAVYKTKPLPKTRIEFEVRSTLYQMLFELEAFLSSKIAFHARYKHFE